MTDAVDLDYFKDKLFAGLRIPKAYFGFGEDTSGMMNQSLTQMDIRYCRTIVRLQNILSVGLKDLCNLYLDLTRTKKARPELPDFKVVFTSPTSSEDDARADVKQKQMQTLKQVLEGLQGIGITLDQDLYPDTRDMIIKEFFGSKFLDTIKQDELAQPAVKPSDNDKKPNLSSVGPSLGGGSNDIISGPDMDNNDLGNEEESSSDEEETDNTINDTEETTSDTTSTSTLNNPPSDEDYELG